MIYIFLFETLHMQSGKYFVIQLLILCYFLTEPPQLYEYIVEVEVSTVDVEVLQQLKDILDNTSLPLRVSDSINITEVNITLTGKNIVFNVYNL